MPKIVVTGGSGFIGSYIALELAKDPDSEVVILDHVPPDSDWPMPENARYEDGDIRYFGEVSPVIAGAEEVYDIAGVLGTSELLYCNARAIDTNIKGAVNVYEACKQHGVKRLFQPTKPNDWLNTYSITKFAAEQFALMYGDNSQVKVCSLKWMNAYGPRQHAYPVRKLIPTFCLQAIHGRPITIYGDGSQTVDLINVEDVASIAVHATRNFAGIGKVVDVGSGEAVTVREVAEKIIAMVPNCKSEIANNPMRDGEPERSSIKADTASLVDDLGYSLDWLTDLDFGLRKTVDYYRSMAPGAVSHAFRFLGL